MKKTSTAYKLLTYLNDGKFHSGETLGQTLGITRSAIWKIMQQLSHEGIEIESAAGKGYRILQGMELLNSSTLTQYFDQTTKNAVEELIILDHIDSTNDYLLSLSHTHPRRSIACFAEYQTKARGRRGRSWVAPFGTNIYHSLLWHFDKDPSEIVGLSLAIGVAVQNTLKQYGIKQDISLKWPNDVLWKGRKLAGILLEMTAEHHGTCSVVIGVGLNTYLPKKITTAIHQPWTDIYEITQSPPKRNQLAGLLLNNICQTLMTFEQQGLTPFITVWRKLDTLIGKTVTLQMANQQICGILQDISEKGELILIHENGQVHRFLSGEISLRAMQQEASLC